GDCHRARERPARAASACARRDRRQRPPRSLSADPRSRGLDAGRAVPTPRESPDWAPCGRVLRGRARRARMIRTVLGVALLAVGVLLVAAAVYIVVSGPTEGIGWPLLIAYAGAVGVLGLGFAAAGIRWARPR